MSMCSVARIPNKGRGVVAIEPISEGTVVECSPVIVLPAEQAGAIEQTLLDEYVFVWGEARDKLAVALGLGSLFNHSYEPNLVYTRELAHEYLVFTALADIEVGEELTINYNGKPDSREPVWFDVP